MTPTYKLYYFNGRGAAEHIRFILAHAGVAYEDIRVPREDWPKFKPDTPFGQVPVLEIDGKKVGQSAAIGRYLAKQYNLAGKNDWESLQCDAIVDTLSDMKSFFRAAIMTEDPVKKAEAVELLKNDKLPYYFNIFEKIIVENKGYTVGGHLTWSDLTLVVMIENLEILFQADLSKYPNVKALKEKVVNLPKIAEWIKKRPESPF